MFADWVDRGAGPQPDLCPGANHGGAVPPRVSPPFAEVIDAN